MSGAYGERAGARTQDLLIKSQLLYRLSYALGHGSRNTGPGWPGQPSAGAVDGPAPPAPAAQPALVSSQNAASPPSWIARRRPLIRSW